MVSTDLDDSGSSPAGVGFLVVPDGYPDAGAVYCAGAGSTVACLPAWSGCGNR